MIRHLFLTIFLTFSLVGVINSQDHHDNHETHATHETGHGKHKISFFSGFTHVQAAFYEHETHEENTGKWIPTIGLDYYYSLSHRWEAGLILDLELDEYYINTSSHNELRRNNVFIAAAVAKYKPTKRIGLFAGPGYETEFQEGHTKSFFVLKTGIEYEVHIENGWEITPLFSYDFKEEYSAYSVGITLGKRF